ncbi:hypothetical protein OUZ56_028481 [Daphnia magna]|uniref:Uncharacterized protein n=1 Tax=Daphnia magna TaxID=35525 RepID=A0ABR0B3Z6_9CRUS|nr:hypothetical protein OUZ56_028481 [Daphnia magna]
MNLKFHFPSKNENETDCLPARTIGEMGNKESVEFITTSGSGPGTAVGDPSKAVMRTSLSMEPTPGTNDEEEVDVELPPPMPLVSTATSVGQQHNSSDNSSATPLASLHSQPEFLMIRFVVWLICVGLWASGIRLKNTSATLAIV